MFNERLNTIVGLLNPALPVWDLCCDHGYIGSAAMHRHPSTHVTFVDDKKHTVDKLAGWLNRSSRVTRRYRVLCADVLMMELPAAAANFVIAGVSTEVIGAFLGRLAGRRGDYIICNTFQSPSRFEARVLALGLTVDTSADVATPSGRQQRVWRLRN